MREDGDHIGADGNPELGFYGVFRCAVEVADAQVLLDPLEEKLDLPSFLVEPCDDDCRKAEVVGQKGQTFAGFWISVDDPAQKLGIAGLGFDSLQADGLVATQAG